jgi:hypothetical protein
MRDIILALVEDVFNKTFLFFSIEFRLERLLNSIIVKFLDCEQIIVNERYIIKKLYF